MKRLLMLGSVMFALSLGAFGCSNTAEGAKEDTAKAGQEVAKATDQAADTTKEAAKNATAALAVTPKVKDAIIADSQLNDPRNLINVDSKDNVVHLTGHVINAAEKDKAGQIAQKVLTDSNATDKLSNELEVKP